MLKHTKILMSEPTPIDGVCAFFLQALYFYEVSNLKLVSRSPQKIIELTYIEKIRTVSYNFLQLFNGRVCKGGEMGRSY